MSGEARTKVNEVIALIERKIHNDISYGAITRQIGVHYPTLNKWVTVYSEKGKEELLLLIQKWVAMKSGKESVVVSTSEKQLISADAVILLLDKYNEGMATLNSIGVQIGVSGDTVKRWVSIYLESGKESVLPYIQKCLTAKDEKSARQPLSPEQQEELISTIFNLLDKYNNNCSTANHISRQIGASRSLIKKWAGTYKEYGKDRVFPYIQEWVSLCASQENLHVLPSEDPRKDSLKVAQNIVDVLEKCISGEIYKTEASRLCGIDTATIRKWVGMLENDGRDSLIPYIAKNCMRIAGKAYPAKKLDLTSEEIISVVKQFKNQEITQAEACRKTGVLPSTFVRWVEKYDIGGEMALFRPSRVLKYTDELRLKAIQEYQTGNYTLKQVCEKYGIKSTFSLSEWLRAYNGSVDNYSTEYSVEGVFVGQARRTTLEERIEIVKANLESGRKEFEIAARYKVSRDQVRYWTNRYLELGEIALEDRRGRRKKDQVPRTELEAAQKEIAELKHKLYLAEVERDLLKKLDEVERREDYRK